MIFTSVALPPPFPSKLDAAETGADDEVTLLLPPDPPGEVWRARDGNGLNSPNALKTNMN